MSSIVIVYVRIYFKQIRMCRRSLTNANTFNIYSLSFYYVVIVLPMMEVLRFPYNPGCACSSYMVPSRRARAVSDRTLGNCIPARMTINGISIAMCVDVN